MIRDDRILPDAFLLRSGEEYLSVNWLESFGPLSRDDAVERVRERLTATGFSLRRNGRLAVLGVEAVHQAGQALDGFALRIEHLPTARDDSHCGIRGYTEADEMIAGELAGLVSAADIYPAHP